jgi:hypothetical protein
MNPKFFGDSYDIVKKSLISWLKPGSEWAVHPMFTEEVPSADACDFARFLNAELLSSKVLKAGIDLKEYFEPCRGVHNLFLDPDTGVRVEGRQSVRHILGETLVEIVCDRPQALTLVFDQSYTRAAETERTEEIRQKLAFFAGHNVYGLAYNSHATFLLLCKNLELLNQAYKSLENSGLPRKRILRNQR